MELMTNRLNELTILGSILRGSADIYHEVESLIGPNTFDDGAASILFTCMKQCFKNDPKCKLDYPILLAAANELGLASSFPEPTFAEIKKYSTDLNNTKVLAKQLRKLEVVRLVHDQMDQRVKNLRDMNGTESIHDILSNTEFDFSKLTDVDSGPELLAAGLKDRVKNLLENPIEQIGISTGYPAFDEAIGGGLRGGSVSIIGARSGVGKSTFLNNVAKHCAGNLDLPVLYLDTEMRKDEQENRLIANLSQVNLKHIETGLAAEKPGEAEKIMAAIKEIEGMKYWHYTIAGMSFEEQLSVMALWFRKHVGFNEDGSPKKCVIFYDYVKLMSSDDMGGGQEYQVLGFMMTSLHNFAVKYNLPIFTAIQLNRDGISKETTDIVSGSDRILWLCTNLAILKLKSEEELSKDNKDNGNAKIVVSKARHGPGLLYPDYINYTIKGETGLITEGLPRSQLVENIDEVEF